MKSAPKVAVLMSSGSVGVLRGGLARSEQENGDRDRRTLGYAKQAKALHPTPIPVS